MSSRLVAGALALLSLPAFAAEGRELILQDLDLRPGVTADVHLRVHERADVPCRAGAILAIPGATATARTLEPVAHAALTEPIDSRPVCQVVTMDLPGKGESPPPVGTTFGELTLQDYAATVIGALERLPAEGVRPVTVMGHSMGGMVVQLVQDALVQQGTSLRDAFGVQHAILLAPAIPASVPWGFRDGGEGAMLLQVFGSTDPVLGSIFFPPPELAPALYFGRLDGTLASNALPVDEMLSAAWMTPESGAAIAGMFGGGAVATADVAPGIFADTLGTRLDIVAFEEDNVIHAVDLVPLFPYLTGKAPGEPGLLLIEGEDAVHGMPQADPQGLLDAFRGHVALP